jgi:hypothetical protein
VLIAIVGFLILEVALVVTLHSRTPAAAPLLPKDIAVGRFEFNRSNSRDNRVYRGQFDLNLHPAENLNSDARQQFLECQPRFAEAVEEAIRRVRAVDFIDPRLTRLKDRIERQLNDELGFEGIGEVEISDFTIEAKPLPAPAAEPAAQ